jgi:predicted acyltransferase
MAAKQDARQQPSTGEARPSRLLSLDVFRGLTIVAMILVNNPGKWGLTHQYWPLAHAEWDGWTPTDLIFPFFLFIVGTSLAYSLRKYRDGATVQSSVYRRIVRRTLLLIFLGWLPFLINQTINVINGSPFDLTNMRIPGVLVRIAVVYLFTSLIVLHIPLRGQVVFGVVLLLGYWAVLGLLPKPDDYWGNLSHEGNVAGVVDRAVLGTNHMYSGDRIVDPEGLLSTFPAIVTALLGYWTGLFIQQRGVNYRTVATLASVGVLLAIVGQTWDLVFPINKKIWTSSYVLLAGGLAMVVLAGCLMKFDIWRWKWLARPWEIVGVNAIFVFVASGLLSSWMNRWRIGNESVHEWIYNNIVSALHSPSIVSLGFDWLTDPKFASLCYALLTVGFWWLVLWIMWRLGWSVRV